MIVIFFICLLFKSNCPFFLTFATISIKMSEQSITYNTASLYLCFIRLALKTKIINTDGSCRLSPSRFLNI